MPFFPVYLGNTNLSKFLKGLMLSFVNKTLNLKYTDLINIMLFICGHDTVEERNSELLILAAAMEIEGV